MLKSAGRLSSELFISSCAPGGVGGGHLKTLQSIFFLRLNRNREEQSQQKCGIKSRQALAASWSRQLLQNPGNFVQPCRFIQSFLHISAVPPPPQVHVYVTTVISLLLLWGCQRCWVPLPTKIKFKKKTNFMTWYLCRSVCKERELTGGCYN